MVKVSMNIENARGAVASLNTVASDVEEAYNTLSSGGAFLGLPTTALANVPGHVQTLKDKSKFLDEKIDLTILINSNGGKNFPTSGTITYEVDKEATTIDEMEVELGKALAKNAEGFATSDFQENDPRLAGMQTYMEKYGSDNEVMGAFYDTLTPAGALALVNAVGDHVGYTHSVSEDESERAKSVLQLLKLGLAAASQEWSEDKAKQYGENLVDAARSPDLKSKYNKIRTGGTEALTWFMYNNVGLSDAFMLGAVEKMHEIQQRDNKAGTPYAWEWAGRSRFFPAVINESDQEWAFDTPSVMFRTLAHHPSAAYKFFDGGSGDERLEYWTKKHDYSRGNVAGTAAALDAASTNSDNMEKHPERAAKMASWAVNGLTQNSTFTDDDLSLGASFEHILETYMPGVQESITDNGEGPDVGETNEPSSYDNKSYGIQPIFKDKALARAIAAIGNNGQAMLDMAEAVQKNTERSAEAVTKEGLKSEMQDASRVEGFFAHAIGSSEISEAEERKEKANAWIQLMSMPVSTYAGIAAAAAPEPTTKAAGWASTILVEKMKEGAISGWEEETKEAISNAEKAAARRRASLDATFLFALDEQGKAGYQGYIPAGEDPVPTVPLPTTYPELVHTDPDGTRRLITRTELDAMSPKEREKALKDIRQIAKGGSGYGYYLSQADIDSAYQNGFKEGYYSG